MSSTGAGTGLPAPFGAFLPLVHRLDLWGVLLGDRLALELHGGRQLVATREPVLPEHRELLDALHVRHLLVDVIDGPPDLLVEALVGRQRRERGVFDSMA